MRVLFASPFLSYHGHIKRIGALVAESMADAGMDLTVMGFPLTYDLLPQGGRLRYISVQDGLSEKARLRIERCRQRFGNVWLFVVETFVVQFLSLKFALRNRFSVVYIADVEPWLLIPALFVSGALRKGLPVVGFMSFLFNVKTSMQRQPWYSRIRSRLNYWAVQYLPGVIDIVHDSRYCLPLYNSKHADRIQIVREGYCRLIAAPSQQESRSLLGLPAGRRILLLFGLASVGKGADLLFEALAGVPSTFDVCIAGKTGGENMPAWGYENVADKSWLGHMHVVSRYLSEEERTRYFASCDAVVLPYRLGFRSASGNFRDAVSYGKAIIVSDQYLMGEMVGKYDLGIRFKPDDVDDLRRALLEFAQKPETWFRGIEERSRAVVQEYSWERVGLSYRELFERIS